MRLELKRGGVLRLSEDVGSPSCGENRAEWRTVAEVSLERLVHALYRMVTGKSKVEFV